MTSSPETATPPRRARRGSGASGAGADSGAATTDASATGLWRIEQTIDDPAGHHDWRIRAEVDLEASVEQGAAVIRVTQVLRL